LPFFNLLKRTPSQIDYDLRRGFCSTDWPRFPKNCAVRICVIFNPVARGDKARRFHAQLDAIRAASTLKLTTSVGDARSLAAEAVLQGFDTVVAAGGDGTLNEVLNGIGDTPDGFERARLGLLPLGTTNVFARELGIPTRLEEAWAVIRRGQETRIDLPGADYAAEGGTRRRYFAQMAGAGLDARAIELLHWPLKKKIGQLAYVVAGIGALRKAPSQVTAIQGEDSVCGELVLIGNGRRYGRRFTIFPRADLRDGLLEVCLFPRTDWFTLAWCAPQLLTLGTLPPKAVRSFRAESITLTSSSRTPLQVDGELIGHLPATFSLQRQKLRVIVL
jgi:YegS/Rv2252/BmrU family lipid kinase